MKKIINIFLAAVMTVSLTACGTSTNEGAAANSPAEAAPEATAEAAVSEEEQIDDEGWDQLASLGKVETENGILFVTITFPADFVGEDVTQESLDEKAGTNYLSAKLNEDGSVTYKMTKKQHKEMMNEFVKNMDDGLQELVDNAEYSIAEINHNKDFTSFDVTLDTKELGLTESFMTLGFYMYGGMYALFSGKKADNVAVNFYNSEGTLIHTANSKDMGDAGASESEPGTAEQFDGSSYNDMGQGTIGVQNQSGSTLEGADVVVYVGDPKTEYIQIDCESRDFNGAALTFIYVDGTLNTKEQMGEYSQTTLGLSGSALEEGVHLVEAVQFEGDDPTGTVTTYKSAQYTVKLK